MVETKKGNVSSSMEDYTPTQLRVAQENPHFSREDVLAVAALRSALIFKRRQIGGFGDTWVGGLAWSDIPEDHKGSCRVSFISHTGRTDTAVFPSYEEAKGAAVYGIYVEIGGYSEVVISAAAEGEAVTHLTYMSWLEGGTHSQPANENVGSAAQSAELIASRIAADIALLRKVCIEPMSIKLSESIDIEVRPKNDDDRVLIGRSGWGYTVVNYTAEGLIMDVYAEGNLQPVHSTSIYSDELETPHSDLHDSCSTTK